MIENVVQAKIMVLEVPLLWCRRRQTVMLAMITMWLNKKIQLINGRRTYGGTGLFEPDPSPSFDCLLVDVPPVRRRRDVYHSDTFCIATQISPALSK